MSNHDAQYRREFGATAGRLHAGRPELTPLELDAVKRDVLARIAGTGTRRSKDMRSRAAILVTLALGFVLSTSGAGLAISGFVDNDQASIAQYGTPTPSTPPNSNNVSPQSPTTQVPENEVLPEKKTEARTPTTPRSDVVQPSRQVVNAATSGSELPFTGFAAIPVLILGLCLVSAGMVLRRRSATR